MKYMNFTVPYPIGTYLLKRENGYEHLDRVEKYVIDEKGIFVILMLDVETDPRLSTAISIDELLRNWREDVDIHLSGNIKTELHIGLPFENESDILIRKLNKKD